jgi:hypothetical protein
MGEKKDAYRVLVGEPEGKRPLGCPTRRWEDIKPILEKQDGMTCIHLDKNRDRWRVLQNTITKLRAP